jgi:CHAT domain-containing protein/Tfp pilus assembly protein PilF
MQARSICGRDLACAIWTILGLLSAGIGKSPVAAAQTAKSPQESTCTNEIASAVPNTYPLLQSGRPITHTLEKGKSDGYCIHTSAGEHAAITLNPRNVRVNIQLLDASQKLVVEWEAQDRIDIVTDSTGQYQLKVLPEYANHSPTTYELNLIDMDLATEQEKTLFEAHRSNTQVGVLKTAGKYNDALKSANEAVRLAVQAAKPDDAFLAQVLANLGWAQSSSGDFAGAEKSFERSLAAIQLAPGQREPQRAFALNGLGLLYARKEEYAKAEELLQQSLEMYRKLYGDDHPKVASCIEDIAVTRGSRGEHQRALVDIKRAIAIDELALEPNDPAIIRMLGDLAGIYIGLGEYDAAQPVLERELALAEKTMGSSHPSVVGPLLSLGRIARKKKDFPKALDYDWRAENISEQTFGPHHPSTGGLLNNIGNVYDSQGDSSRALEAFQRAYNILQDSLGPYHERTLLPLANMARVYVRMGDTLQAIECLKRENEGVERTIALNLIVASEHERLAYIDKYSDVVSQIISMSVQSAPRDKNARDLAALVVLQRKGRVQDAMSDSMVTLRSHLRAEDQTVLDQLSMTATTLAKLSLGSAAGTSVDEHRRQIASLEEQRESLEIEIGRRSRGYYERSDHVTLNEVRAAIPSDAVLIEFAIYRPYGAKAADIELNGEPRYIAYVISSDREVGWKDLGREQEIDDAVRGFRQALRNPRNAGARELARSLDERIFRPVRELIGAAQHWIISPDGQLNFVPFESLVDEHGHFLLENHSISYVTTGRDLLRMNISRPSQSSPVFVANPLFGETIQAKSQSETTTFASARGSNSHRSITIGDDPSSLYFAPLSGTAEEATQLRVLFPNARILIGSQASKADLKQVNAPEILHIATHGFFLNDEQRTETPGKTASSSNGNRNIQAGDRIENPLLRSGLALAGANLDKDGQDNGILTALEASSLNLWGTKLVTLSACDTAVGEVKNGEGVYGLRRAFVLAGAQSIVTSLWSISDYTTRQLMTDYYRGLRNGQGRGEALRRAQLAMLKRKGREHPFYWASFIQFGDWRSLNGR